MNYARRLQHNGHAQAVIRGAVEELSDDREQWTFQVREPRVGRRR